MSAHDVPDLAYGDAPDSFDSPDGRTYSGTPAVTPGIEVTHEPEIPVYLVQMWLCDPCLDGEGEQCHTPGCSLWIHDAPKPALRGSQGVTILGPALEPFMTPGEYREHVAAQQPQPALATVDLHRWYAVITQPNGMTKVIGHTSDGLGYYDSVDEWEAKNS